MNHTNGWMSGSMGGGMWIWSLIVVLLVVVIIIVTSKLSKK